MSIVGEPLQQDDPEHDTTISRGLQIFIAGTFCGAFGVACYCGLYHLIAGMF